MNSIQTFSNSTTPHFGMAWWNNKVCLGLSGSSKKLPVIANLWNHFIANTTIDSTLKGLKHTCMQMGGREEIIKAEDSFLPSRWNCLTNKLQPTLKQLLKCVPIDHIPEPGIPTEDIQEAGTVNCFSLFGGMNSQDALQQFEVFSCSKVPENITNKLLEDFKISPNLKKFAKDFTNSLTQAQAACKTVNGTESLVKQPFSLYFRCLLNDTYVDQNSITASGNVPHNVKDRMACTTFVSCISPSLQFRLHKKIRDFFVAFSKLRGQNL